MSLEVDMPWKVLEAAGGSSHFINIGSPLDPCSESYFKIIT